MAGGLVNKVDNGIVRNLSVMSGRQRFELPFNCAFRPIGSGGIVGL